VVILRNKTLGWSEITKVLNTLRIHTADIPADVTEEERQACVAVAAEYLKNVGKTPGLHRCSNHVKTQHNLLILRAANKTFRNPHKHTHEEVEEAVKVIDKQSNTSGRCTKPGCTKCNCRMWIEAEGGFYCRPHGCPLVTFHKYPEKFQQIRAIAAALKVQEDFSAAAEGAVEEEEAQMDAEEEIPGPGGQTQLEGGVDGAVDGVDTWHETEELEDDAAAWKMEIGEFDDDLKLGEFWDAQDWDTHQARKIEVLLACYDGLTNSELALLVEHYYSGGSNLEGITALRDEIRVRRLIAEEEARVFNSWHAQWVRGWRWGTSCFEP